MGQRAQIREMNNGLNAFLRQQRLAERITAGQIRAARALLGMRLDGLADFTGLHLETVRRLENDQKHDACRQSVHETVRQALEVNGVVFIPASDGQGPGVRLLRDLTA